MAVIREHLANKRLGLHDDLQTEHSIGGNNVGLLLMLNHESDEQREEWLPKMLSGKRGFAFGIATATGSQRDPRRLRCVVPRATCSDS